MQEDIVWKNETRKVIDLIPASYNPRKLSDEQKEQIKKSLDKFNLADPIIINLDNKIIGGHQRILILKELEVENVDVRVPNRQLTDEEEKELNIRLNKNSGEWENKLLIDFGKDFLSKIGFSNNELYEIFKNEEEEKVKNTRTIVFTVSKDEDDFIRKCLDKERDNPNLTYSGKRLKQSDILISLLKKVKD